MSKRRESEHVEVSAASDWARRRGNVVGSGSQHRLLGGHRATTLSSVSPFSHVDDDSEIDTPRSQDTIGFLGPTSFSAVFSDRGPFTSQDADAARSRPGQNEYSISSDRVLRGARLLAMLLNNRPLFSRASRRIHLLWDAGIVPQPLFQLWCDEISLYLDCTNSPDSEQSDDYRELSKMVWSNSVTRAQVHESMQMKAWAKAFTGLNLRWETTGIIFATLGLTALKTSDWDAMRAFHPNKDMTRHTFVQQMKAALDTCLGFCSDCEVMNEVYLMLLIQEACFLEQLKGDMNYTVWKQHGITCDTIVAIGLHRITGSSRNHPVWYRELRKQLLAICYCRDKAFSYSLGRPPRLMAKFCCIEQPADISLDELFAGTSTLEDGSPMFDERGWNKSQIARRETFLRIRVQYCRIREDILSIALAYNNGNSNDVLNKAREIREALDGLSGTFPAWMLAPLNEVAERLKTHQPLPVNDMTSRSYLISLLSVHVALLQTEFLLGRALVDHKLETREALIPLVRQILDIVVAAAFAKELFYDFPSDVASLLVSHGIPCAGVLSIELLKEHESSVQTLSKVPGQRSDAIQKLGLLVAALANVDTDNPHYVVCSGYEKVLRRLLDQILEYGLHSRPTDQAPANADTASLSFPIDPGADFLQWLDGLHYDGFSSAAFEPG